MDTGRRLLAVAVLAAAPLLAAGPAQAMLPTHECFVGPCQPDMVGTVIVPARDVAAYRHHGWRCWPLYGRTWACTKLRG